MPKQWSLVIHSFGIREIFFRRNLFKKRGPPVLQFWSVRGRQQSYENWSILLNLQLFSWNGFGECTREVYVGRTFKVQKTTMGQFQQHFTSSFSARRWTMIFLGSISPTFYDQLLFSKIPKTQKDPQKLTVLRAASKDVGEINPCIADPI